MKVPLIDLRAQYVSIKDEIDEAVARVHESANYVMGPEVEAFEHEWARYCGATFCVAVCSGTDAIYLTLQALWERVSHIVVPAFTFIASIEPAFRAGYPASQVHLEDVDANGVLGPIKAIDFQQPDVLVLPVHLYGYPAPMPEGASYVLEDAAQAHGQQLRGDAQAFSFYPTKNLGAAGQAGAVVTNSPELSGELKILRNHGEADRRFVHERLSGNYRMDELQAAILRAKLPHLADWNAKRREIALVYRAELAGLPLKFQADHEAHTYHIFAIRCERRDELAEFLQTRGIQTAVRYPVPLHLQPALARSFGRPAGTFPGAEAWARETLSLPIYPEMDWEQVGHVVQSVKQYFAMQDVG